jgi:hypothetical protein
MGMMMIAEITPPMMTIWSVDPITERYPAFAFAKLPALTFK